ncbi:MAG: hypothetical protein HY608_08925 [Planctomycetes bacterium]|nr:hypothetical protein [Planctomycetota bacterium]
MPIAVACACGKRLQVPDAMAGKRGKCPACGGVIEVKAAAASPPVVAVADKIRVACACGKALAVPASYAGKKVKCPGCGNVLVVPGPAAAAPSAVPKPAPAVAAPPKAPVAAKAAKGAAAVPKPHPKAAESDPERKPLHDRHDCPGCGKFVSFFDAICLDCGTNMLTGVKAEMKILEPDKTLMERVPWMLVGKIAAGGLLAVGGFLAWWFFIRSPGQ